MISSMTIPRGPFVLRTCWTVGSLAVLVSVGTAADDARDRQRAELLEQMRALARETRVAFADGRSEDLLRFVDKPIFRYDDQPRRFLDATVWVWTRAGRPVALQKIEAKRHQATDQPQWGYCFTSLADDRLQVTWSDDRNYQSQEPGVTFRPVPDAPAVAEDSLRRRRQLRELARQFSARILINPATNRSEEMRLLTTPLWEYEDEATRKLTGALFAFSTSGTNPDLVIWLEARPANTGLVWNYAPARMTTGGLTVSYRDDSAWQAPFVPPRDPAYATWTFFSTDRTPVETE
jgi:hypothetical protein